MHITASVFINDDERGLHQDYDNWSEELAPHEPISRYRHNCTGEACPEAPPERVEGRSQRDNGDAHLKRQVMDREVDLSAFSVVDANVEASGASQVTVNVSGRLDVDASNASHVTYLGSPTLGKMDSVALRPSNRGRAFGEHPFQARQACHYRMRPYSSRPTVIQ
jgi:hypothetical protein